MLGVAYPFNESTVFPCLFYTCLKARTVGLLVMENGGILLYIHGAHTRVIRHCSARCTSTVGPQVMEIASTRILSSQSFCDSRNDYLSLCLSVYISVCLSCYYR